MPGEDLGKRIIFLELGPLLRKPSGLWVCITDDTRERGRRMFWSQVIRALIVAGPWFWAGSLSTCLRIICSLTCAGILWTACDLLPCRPSCWRRRLIVLALDKTICKSTFILQSYHIHTWFLGPIRPENGQIFSDPLSFLERVKSAFQQMYGRQWSLIKPDVIRTKNIT